MFRYSISCGRTINTDQLIQFGILVTESKSIQKDLINSNQINQALLLTEYQVIHS